MTTATTTKFTGFADKQPAYLRSVIVPEDHESFDRGYQAALDAARDNLDLAELDGFLEHWRRTAWSQHHMGHDRWRAMLTKADYILEHGHPPPGTVTYTADQIRQQIADRMARGEQVYRVVIHNPAQATVAVLPSEALDDYARVLDLLELDPWSGPPFDKDKPDENMRILAFCGTGLMTYMILDREQEVHVIEIQWVG